MGKISLKAVFYAVFAAGGVLCLGGCIEPVDLSRYVNDEEVREIIEKGDGIVNLAPGSDSGLNAGNKKVTGLDPEKYYYVEEWDENGVSLGLQFVGASGERGENLTDIGRVSGGEITGLTNSNHYRVKSAEPLPGNVPYNAAIPSGGPGLAANTDGSITLLGPVDNSSIVYTLTPPASPAYQIVEIPIAPLAGSASSAKRTSPNGPIITLIERETVIDYVFFAELINSFVVLRVTAGERTIPSEPGGDGSITIDVTLSYTGDSSPDLGPSTDYFQDDTGTITFTVSNAADYDDYTTTGIIWYYDGLQVGTGPTFGLNKDLPEYKILGVHIITVEASKEGIPYSATIEVEVKP